MRHLLLAAFSNHSHRPRTAASAPRERAALAPVLARLHRERPEARLELRRLTFPGRYRCGAFIGQHGSWNRSGSVGYRVAFVPFANGRPSGTMEEFLTGFIADSATGEVWGRPVGWAVAPDGALLVADDAEDRIWRVAARQVGQAMRASPSRQVASMGESISKQQGGLPAEFCPGGSCSGAVDAAFPRSEVVASPDRVVNAIS